METTSPVTIVTFVLYITGTFVLAALSHRLLSKKKFMGEYFLGSRGLGSWALAFTFAATSASGGSFTGYPALIYSFGWVLALWIASYMVMPLTTMAVMGKRLNQVARKTGAITIPDVIRDRFESTGLGLFASCSLIFFMVANLVGQFKAGAIILETTFNLPATFSSETNQSLIPGVKDGYLLGLVLFAAVVIFYTAYGGFRAVVWTDVMQGVVMGLGVLLLIPIILTRTGGLTRVNETLMNRAPFAVTSFKGANYDLAFLLNEEAETHLPVGVRFVVGKEKEDAEAALFNDEKGKRWIQIRLKTIKEDGRDKISTTADDIKEIVWNTPQVNQFLVQDDKNKDGIQNAFDNDGTGTWNWDDSQPETVEYPFLYGDEWVFGPGRRVDGSPFHTLGMVITFFFMWAISGMGQPGTMVRLMAFKDSQTLKRAIITVTFYFAIIYLPLVFIFVSARTTELAYIPAESADKAMSLVATRLVAQDFWSSILAAILVAAPFAAVMSTVDSFLLLISSAFVRDIYQRSINPQVSERSIKIFSYTVTALVGVTVASLAIRQIDYLQYIIVFTTSGLASVFLWPVFLGIYWSGFTRQGAWSAMIGGFATHVSLFLPVLFGGREPFYLLGFYPVFWSISIPLLLGIVVSRLTGPPPQHLVDKYFRVPVKGDS